MVETLKNTVVEHGHPDLKGLHPVFPIPDTISGENKIENTDSIINTQLKTVWLH